ncbi:MAG: PilZ domain-containing protein [Deltaproteobacteria bacterium]|nr:PilZ domain-containing protein [Deltaproteobacteria bacterium]
MVPTIRTRSVARRAVRRAVDLPCELITRYVDEPLLCWATDLSPLGAWIETPGPLWPGEVVVLSLRPIVRWPHREITVFAHVVRIAVSGRGERRDEPGMGLEFRDLNRYEFGALQGWLRHRPPPLPRRRRRLVADHRLPPPRGLVCASGVH